MREKSTLVKIFTPTNLKLLEYIIRREENNEEHIISLYDLAKKIGVSPTSLSLNYKKLVDSGILLVREYKTDNGWCKVLEIDYENELVDVLVKALKALIDVVNGFKLIEKGR
jgi:predicted transcriptional regulator